MEKFLEFRPPIFILPIIYSLFNIYFIPKTSSPKKFYFSQAPVACMGTPLKGTAAQF